MASRPPAEAVTQGLTTTSAKIRALARAGYLRSEIRKLLEISYPRVRNVLVDAGITQGLQQLSPFKRRLALATLPESAARPFQDAGESSATASRPFPGAVIENLTTTSEKIRALAHAGYLRTEISKLLDTRYQNVRKVLVAAGITDGVQRPPFKPKVTELLTPSRSAAAISHNPTDDLLLRAGFKMLGNRGRHPGRGLELSASTPTEAIYAFVVDGHVRYVGLTVRGPRQRIDHHRGRNVRLRTNARVKALIQAALSAGKPVSALLVSLEPEACDSGPVATAAGLEAGLSLFIRPGWTLRGAV